MAIFGNIKSLSRKEQERLEKLSKSKSRGDDIISTDLAQKIADKSIELGMMIGILLNRSGEIEYLIVGTKNRVYLPDLGRFRIGKGRLRRLRLVVFYPGEMQTPQDLITDLEKLRLDLVAFCNVNKYSTITNFYVSYLQFNFSINPNSYVVTQHFKAFFDCNVNFEFLVSGIEADYVKFVQSTHDIKRDGAVLVGVYTVSSQESLYRMDELKELTRSAGIDIVDSIIQRRKDIDPKTVIGKGKLEEIVLHCLDLGIELIIFDGELTPGQLRVITNLTELKVIDRSMLILDIFAQRAKTREGKLQVELAQLKYTLPRLTDRDTGLSRLSGGIGGRGPGETKLEIGRRRVRDRIAELEKRIDEVGKQREVRRKLRKNRGVPVIAIVGYTNAGKSTLLNSLTNSTVFSESKMFATLDPSSRRLRFPNQSEVVFVDTVGFIRDLPQELVNAFRATLEEVRDADILIHLVDVSSPDLLKQLGVVEKTLEDLDLNKKSTLLVMNKIDKLQNFELEALTNRLNGIPISAANKKGFSQLIYRIQEELVGSFAGQDPGEFLTLYQQDFE